MNGHFITPLSTALEPFWQARFEQVQLKVEHNFKDYPLYQQHYAMYHDEIGKLKELYPSAADDVEHLVTALHLYYSDLAMEAYRQGAKDWMQMFHTARCPHGICPTMKEE